MVGDTTVTAPKYACAQPPPVAYQTHPIGRRSLPWYPDGLGWQIDCPKNELRKSEVLRRLHKWLVRETELGNVSRQEAVSMIPPLLLGVQPHHTVRSAAAKAPCGPARLTADALVGARHVRGAGL